MRRVGKPHQKRDRPEVCDFQVIGELKADPQHLLLLGDDGLFYSMDAESGDVRPIDLDDSWAVDVIDNASRHINVSKDIVA